MSEVYPSIKIQTYCFFVDSKAGICHGIMHKVTSGNVRAKINYIGLTTNNVIITLLNVFFVTLIFYLDSLKKIVACLLPY